MKDTPNTKNELNTPLNVDENTNAEVVDDIDDDEDEGESWTAGDDDDEGWIEEAQKRADELYNNDPEGWITVEILNREQSATRHAGGYTIIKSRKPGDKKD
jgi:hypothetical protein